MIYKKSCSKKKKIIIAIFSLFLFFILLNIFQKNVRCFFYDLSFPIQKACWTAGGGAADFLNSFLKSGSIKKDLENLKLENQQLISDNQALKGAAEENQALKEAMRMETDDKFDLIPCQVSFKSPGQDIIMINKGEKDGIAKKMPVVTSGKALVGRVSEVYKNYSKITLISENGFSFDAKIEKDGKEIFGVAKGGGLSKIFLDLILREENVSAGDLVLTSGASGVFPDNLLAGKIKTAKIIDVESLQKIEIDPFFNLDGAKDLFVISNF